MIRLIATDLDGTLLRRDLSISERTRAALHAARDQGVVVVFITARQPAGMRHLAREAGVGGLAVASNGAVVYDLDRDEVVRCHDLPARTAARIVDALRRAVPGVLFAAVRRAGAEFHAEPLYADMVQFTDHHRHVDGMLLADALSFCAEPATKLIARHPDMPPEELLHAVNALGFEGFSATHSGAPFVEILAAGISKARALEALCVDLGITREEVVAFGDHLNDLPMLRWAGQAYAVANAHPQVLAEVRRVTLSNDEDGVARVVEQLLAGHPSSRSPAGTAAP